MKIPFGALFVILFATLAGLSRAAEMPFRNSRNRRNSWASHCSPSTGDTQYDSLGELLRRAIP
jgi:hypothetical protein